MTLTPEQKELQRVVCAAIRWGDTIIIGARHFDSLMHRTIAMRTSEGFGADAREREIARRGWAKADQGFIDQWGNFLTRKEAWNVAVRQSQILRLCGNQDSRIDDGDDLYSENLY